MFYTCLCTLQHVGSTVGCFPQHEQMNTLKTLQIPAKSGCTKRLQIQRHKLPFSGICESLNNDCELWANLRGTSNMLQFIRATHNNSPKSKYQNPFGVASPAAKLKWSHSNKYPGCAGCACCDVFAKIAGGNVPITPMDGVAWMLEGKRVAPEISVPKPAEKPEFFYGQTCPYCIYIYVYVTYYRHIVFRIMHTYKSYVYLYMYKQHFS